MILERTAAMIRAAIALGTNDKPAKLASIYANHGYPYKAFTIFGGRSVARPNKFDDFIGVSFCADPSVLKTLEAVNYRNYSAMVGRVKEGLGGDQRQILYWPATTDPGTVWDEPTKKRYGIKSAEHVCLGYYPGLYAVGSHRGYEAFKQVGKITCWLDDGDGVFEVHEIKSSGWFAVNLHRALESGEIANVGVYSAGCQVIQNPDNFARLLVLAKASGLKNFDYSLFMIDSLKGIL